MPLDPRVKRFLDVLTAAKLPNVLQPSVAERRAGLAELMKLSGPQPTVSCVEDRSLPGLQGHAVGFRIYTPLNAKSGILPGLIYFHGGGLVAGSIATHDCFARALTNASACRVISVEYRLAPEYPFPAALDDALAAATYISAHATQLGIDRTRIGICGDSAGGTLAAATTQSLVQIGGPRLALQLLICPILDYSRLTLSRRDLANGYLLDQATLDHDLLHYLAPGTDPANPRISPLRATDFRGLPHTLIHAAEFDPLRDEARDYSERLSQANSEVSYTCHPGMIHLFYGLGAVIPYARTALEQIGGEIRAAWALTEGE